MKTAKTNSYINTLASFKKVGVNVFSVTFDLYTYRNEYVFHLRDGMVDNMYEKLSKSRNDFVKYFL